MSGVIDVKAGTVWRTGTAVTAKSANRRHKRNCRSAPSVPTGVVLTFHRREMGRRDRWRARAKWNPVEEDVAGRAVSVEAYQVHLRATDASGDPVETTLQDEARRADGAEFTVHAGSAPTNDNARELNAASDVIKKALTGLTTGIACQVNFYACEDVGASEPRLKFEIWNVTDSASVASKNETLSGVFPKLYVTRTFTPAVGKTYEARVTFVSGTGIGLFHHLQWHDLGDAANWRQLIQSDEDPLDAVFADIPRPRSWFYAIRVRALNRTHGVRCWSAWSAWTTPTAPATGAVVGPPAPTGVTLIVDRVEGARKTPWRAKVRWNEVPWWFPPDDEPVEGAAGYHVQLAVSNNGGATTANVRRKTVEADDSDGNTTANANFTSNIRGRRHYRARVKAYDGDGRRGAWSGWTPWSSPGGAPDPPINLSWSNPTPSQLVAKWDDPVDLTDVDRYFVQVIRAGGTIVDAGYTDGTRWRYSIPRADRGVNHKVRVRSMEDPVRLDVDEDVAASWTAAEESTTVETSEVPNAEMWNLEDVAVQDMSGNPMLRITGFPRCKVRYTAGGNLPHADLTYIRWGTEDVDTDNFHPATIDGLAVSGGPNYEFTLPFAGQYLVIFAAKFDTNATGRRQIQVLLNGVAYESVVVAPVSGADTSMNGSFFVDAAASDVIAARVFQNSGAGLALLSARFSIVYFGPA